MPRLVKIQSKLIRIERAKGLPGQGHRGAKVNYIFECISCGVEFASKKRKSKLCCLKCAKEYYKSKPIERVCIECANRFFVYMLKGTYSKRKTCSKACELKQRAKNQTYKSPERNRKISDHCIMSHSVAPLHTKESREKAGQSISKAKIWVHNLKKAALSVSKKQRMVCLISTDGKEFYTNCIRGFVRNNESLFSKNDVERRMNGLSAKTTIEGNMTCRAMKGLESISTGKRNTWKGWSIDWSKSDGF